MATRNEEQRVQEIIADILRRREAGEELKDEEVLAANPELADKLKERLKQLQIVANARRLAALGEVEETISHTQNASTISNGGNRKIVPGQQIRHYVLEEQIGLGGFGSVWRARDTKLDCEVAIKIPARDSLTSNDIDRFIREARMSAQLRQHPNIVSVHEADWDDQTAFIVCDLIDGESLGDRIDKSRVPPDEAVKFLVQICGALQHAHNAGVIHRDLKPDNILLDADGNPHITDFGLAMRESQIAATDSSRIMGTAAYMSPEQARGESDRADCRSDLFSLGVVLFELLTGERPFRGSVPLILRQIVSNDPLRPRSFDPRIPVDLETICLKCLEKDPARRYESANELSEDLQRYRRHEPIQARPVSTAGRLLRWSKRNPSIPLLSLSLMVVTICSAWASFRFLDNEVAEMQAVQVDKAQESLERLALYAAHDAKSNLDLRFYQVRNMRADLEADAILMMQLVKWNDLDRKKTILKGLETDWDNPPVELEQIQAELLVQKEKAPPDIVDRTYSFFVCDAEGYQIARLPQESTLGTRFGYRSYFTGDVKDAPEATNPKHKWGGAGSEPRLSDSFLPIKDPVWVIAVSAPIYDANGKFQGVVGIFIELDDLISNPAAGSSTEGTDNSSKRDSEVDRAMLVLDARQGKNNARVIHHSDREIQAEMRFDLSRIPEELPLQKFASRGIKQRNVPKSRLWVLTQVPAEEIEAPGRRLRANLVTIGLSVVGFAALVLSSMWVIILQRVVKT